MSLKFSDFDTNGAISGSVKWTDGTEIHFLNRKLHREEHFGPAVQYNGVKYYMQNDKLHRVYGPARYRNERMWSYWLHGVPHRKANEGPQRSQYYSKPIYVSGGRFMPVYVHVYVEHGKEIKRIYYNNFDAYVVEYSICPIDEYGIATIKERFNNSGELVGFEKKSECGTYIQNQEEYEACVRAIIERKRRKEIETLKKEVSFNLTKVSELNEETNRAVMRLQELGVEFTPETFKTQPITINEIELWIGMKIAICG